ncbi:MAG: diversity-generating retroelement protein Avd [Candidatus Zhuqueibacterota bacterium]
MQESPLFIKTYDFLKWLLEHTQQYPKSQRFVLAQRVNDAALNFHELLIKATKSMKKLPVLYEADYELERLRLNLRLSKDLALLKFNHYEHGARQLTEIGKLLGGWIKKIQEGTEKKG